MRERVLKFFCQCAIGACMVLSCVMVSCTQDNVHMPDVEPETEAWETYAQDFSGEFHTTVPLVQENLQGPVITSTRVRIENFHIKHSGYVCVRTEAFAVDDPFVVGILGKAIEIGAMTLDNVEYAAFPSGGGCLMKKDFDVQAGEYRTRGSLEGTISKEDVLSFVMKYRPGTMPFEIVTEFR